MTSTQLPDPGWGYTHQDGTANFPATSTTVEVVENGPLRAKIKVTYNAVRPCFGNYGQYVEKVGNLQYWQVSSPTSYYICTITVEAGQPVIMVEQETDNHPDWHINMNTGVGANRARWRGWGLFEGTDPKYGHNYDGTLYGSQQSNNLDAEVILSELGTEMGMTGSASQSLARP